MNPIQGIIGVVLVLAAFSLSLFSIPGSFNNGSADPNARGVFQIITPLQTFQLALAIIGFLSVGVSMIRIKGPRKG